MTDSDQDLITDHHGLFRFSRFAFYLSQFDSKVGDCPFWIQLYDQWKFLNLRHLPEFAGSSYHFWLFTNRFSTNIVTCTEIRNSNNTWNQKEYQTIGWGGNNPLDGWQSMFLMFHKNNVSWLINNKKTDENTDKTGMQDKNTIPNTNHWHICTLDKVYWKR